MNCGKDMNEGTTDQSTIKKAPYNTMCIIGLVVSGISLLVNMYGLIGVAGIVLSAIGLKSSNRKNENGKALAIIGIAIGGFSTLYFLIAVFIKRF